MNDKYRSSSYYRPPILILCFTRLRGEALKLMEQVGSNMERIPSIMSASADTFERVATQEVNSKQDTPVRL